MIKKEEQSLRGLTSYGAILDVYSFVSQKSGPVTKVGRKSFTHCPSTNRFSGEEDAHNTFQPLMIERSGVH